MYIQFIAENIAFTIHILTGLVLLAGAWLYFDAWLPRKSLREFFKVIAFVLLGISFILGSIQVHQYVWQDLLIFVTRGGGYLCLVIGLLTDPLQKRPKTQGLKSGQFQLAFLTIPSLSPVVGLAYPLGAVFVALLYLRKAILGLEKHLLRVALAFFFYGIYEFFMLTQLLRDTSVVSLYELVAPYGLFWILAQGTLLLATLIFGSWVVGYLLKRIQSQLFLVLSIAVLVIFIITTASFTLLLTKTIEQGVYRQLKTDANLLQLVLDTKQEQVLSDARLAASDPAIIAAVKVAKPSTISPLLEASLTAKKESFLFIVDADAKIIGRGEDQAGVGQSLSDNIVVRHVLKGKEISSLITQQGAVSPQVYVEGAVPIKEGNRVIGAVLTGILIDSAFLNSVYQTTGLQSAIYGEQILSATAGESLTDALSKVGSVQNNPEVTKVVFDKGQDYIGSLRLFQIPYFTLYTPLKDMDTNTIGMLFVSREQATVLETAEKALELTFTVSVVMLMVSFIPIFYISRRIANQLR